MSAVAMERAARNELALSLWQRMKSCEAAKDDRGWQRARTSLFEMFEKLSFKIAGRLLQEDWLSRPDMEQECRVACIQAIDKWDPARGEFPVLLSFYVRKRLKDWRFRGEMIRRTYSAFEKHWQDTRQGLDGEETASITVDRFLQRAGDKIDFRDEYYDLSDSSLANDDSEDPYNRVELFLAVERALDKISDQDRQCVCLHYGLRGKRPHTYREIGPLIGSTHQTACNRVRHAMPVLAKALEGCL